MSSMSAPSPRIALRRARRSGLARWWLAGLLVSCLLPVSLSPLSAVKSSERAATICLWVPAILRVQSQRLARRRRVRSLLRRVKKITTRVEKRRLIASRLALPRVAARDVLIPRGPPAAQRHFRLYRFA
ncbi:hypothetical protein RN346_07345 [Halomonas sp. PAMB 3232]|uniref:hypothetical protein n=1 Tax=Halomonas sp. PAMB 3232 TaxID=3075221 RepID=UPI00289FA04E|nr:hypothetical protein [Halomonas sp. PAMB 3232]WNL40370.1 hypothetical protein RN346_07345 [Halomonas sp. PAMB 3232]